MYESFIQCLSIQANHNTNPVGIATEFCTLDKGSGAQKRVPRSTLRSSLQYPQERNETSSICKFVERNVT